MSLTIPIAEVADLFLNGLAFQVEYIIGSVLVFLGFILANVQFRSEIKSEEEQNTDQ